MTALTGAPAASLRSRMPAAPATLPLDGPVFTPRRRLQLANFAVFQAAWFAAVLGAAHRLPLAGTAGVIAAIAWHVAVSARPVEEAKLVAALCAIGFVVESAIAFQGHVAYPSGQPVAYLAPYWMVALWGELAIALNVTLRWLKHRAWAAAALGAVVGPTSFASGVRLGGARFVDTVPALVTLACVWAVLMPLLMRLSNRFDGVRSLPHRAMTGAPRRGADGA